MVLMKMTRGIVLVAGAVAAALTATGCAAPSTTGGSGAKMNIAVAAYPLQFLAERIVGDAGTVTNLTPPGTEPHDLELSARQVADLAASDAVVYIAGFQAAVDDAIKTATPKLAINAAAKVSLLTAGQDGADGGGELPASAVDPHVWLSPANMVTMAQTISDALVTARPDLASTITTNTTSLEAELKALDQHYRSGLASCARPQFITSHAAFGYLAHEYGLVQIPIAGLDPTTEPSAARIAAVQKLAKQYGVTTIFFETLTSDAVAKSIAGDLHLQSAVLDPIEGITSTSAGTNYLEVMQSNLTALQKANQCH
jgi:zinc transport system substrate-binding protein